MSNSDKKSTRLSKRNSLEEAEYLIGLGISILPPCKHNKFNDECCVLTKDNIRVHIHISRNKPDHPLISIIENEIDGDSYFHKKITNKYEARDIDWGHYGIGTVCGRGNVIGVSFKNWATFYKAHKEFGIPEPSNEFKHYIKPPKFIFKAPELIKISSSKDSLIAGMEIHGEGSFLKLYDEKNLVFIDKTLTDIPHLLLAELEGIDHGDS